MPGPRFPFKGRVCFFARLLLEGMVFYAPPMLISTSSCAIWSASPTCSLFFAFRKGSRTFVDTFLSTDFNSLSGPPNAPPPPPRSSPFEYLGHALSSIHSLPAYHVFSMPRLLKASFLLPLKTTPLIISALGPGSWFSYLPRFFRPCSPFSVPFAGLSFFCTRWKAHPSSATPRLAFVGDQLFFASSFRPCSLSLRCLPLLRATSSVLFNGKAQPLFCTLLRFDFLSPCAKRGCSLLTRPSLGFAFKFPL